MHPSKAKLSRLRGLALVPLVALPLFCAFAPAIAQASSHRDAPLIAEDPSADNTDLYAFRAADTPTKLTVISNWIPGEDPAAGPNYYRFSPTARYYIHIDKDGDGKPDVSYRFVFKNTADDPLFFLNGTKQTYTATKIVGKTETVIALNKPTPPDYVGPRSNSSDPLTASPPPCNDACYKAVADGTIVNLVDGTNLFAGQRADPFFGDIGAIFDNLHFRNIGGLFATQGGHGGGTDFFANYNVHSIAMQIPVSELDNGSSHSVGVWSTTERPGLESYTQRTRVRVYSRRHRKTGVIRYVVSHPVRPVWNQVSRLGNPLFNEAVVPTVQKDLYNRSTPDKDSQFAAKGLAPDLATAMNLFYSVGAPTTNRTDLAAVFLTGFAGVNKTGTALADELRVNLTTPITGSPDRLGVIAGDNQGFPNGRRLNDDVIDIAEQAVAGETFTPAMPNNLGDGVDGPFTTPLTAFPYVAEPYSGFANAKGTAIVEHP